MVPVVPVRLTIASSPSRKLDFYGTVLALVVDSLECRIKDLQPHRRQKQRNNSQTHIYIYLYIYIRIFIICILFYYPKEIYIHHGSNNIIGRRSFGIVVLRRQAPENLRRSLVINSSNKRRNDANMEGYTIGGVPPIYSTICGTSSISFCCGGESKLPYHVCDCVPQQSDACQCFHDGTCQVLFG
jgi:hypothetical protein